MEIANKVFFFLERIGFLGHGIEHMMDMRKKFFRLFNKDKAGCLVNFGHGPLSYEHEFPIKSIYT